MHTGSSPPPYALSINIPSHTIAHTYAGSCYLNHLHTRDLGLSTLSQLVCTLCYKPLSIRNTPLSLEHASPCINLLSAVTNPTICAPGRGLVCFFDDF
jgi:hypothetical protein